MVNVLITGFKNNDEAKEFINWYEGQGEQDASIWFECRIEEGSPIRDFIGCNIEKTFHLGEPMQDVNGNWIMDVSDR